MICTTRRNAFEVTPRDRILILPTNWQCQQAVPWRSAHSKAEGRGLLKGFELVADRATKPSSPPDLNLHARIKREAMARGLMVYPMGGTIDGVHGDHLLIAPPFIGKPAHIDVIVERLGDAIDAPILN